mmetsp:Transcript_7487/g.11011  ORF Transcript_7487/g.11011 Transcript_7487/m.11011 type:complete len:426 (+) Transcript_7487:304-1581(+)
MKHQEERHRKKMDTLNSDWSQQCTSLQRHLDSSEREISRLNSLLNQRREHDDELNIKYKKLQTDLKNKEAIFQRKEYMLTNRIMELTQDVEDKARALELWARTQSEFETVKRVLSQKNSELNEREAMVLRRQTHLDEQYAGMKQSIERKEESIRQKDLELQERVHKEEQVFMARQEALERRSKELEEHMERYNSMSNQRATFHHMKNASKDEPRQREEAVALMKREASAREHAYSGNVLRTNAVYSASGQGSTSHRDSSVSNGAHEMKKRKQNLQPQYSHVREDVAAPQNLTQAQPLVSTTPNTRKQSRQARAGDASQTKDAARKKQSKPSRTRSKKRVADTQKAKPAAREKPVSSPKTGVATRNVCSLQGHAVQGVKSTKSPSSTKKSSVSQRMPERAVKESKNATGKVVVCIDESSESGSDSI